MEEDLKVLEELIKEFDEFEEKQKLNVYMLTKKERQAIENLIKGYKELETINKIQEYRISVIDERELIPKSKVREKIEESIEELYEEMEELDSYDEDDNEEKRELTDMIVLLKELQKELLQDKE